jgi:hypothetical protein
MNDNLHFQGSARAQVNLTEVSNYSAFLSTSGCYTVTDKGRISDAEFMVSGFTGSP